ncbi:MAG: septum formation initiator family protein [Bacilli bacterium]|nr:septum formation initiator family protein [Bacilli bacterium]MBR3209791.1 septum formation initiator family protein [Bacilli bacterium]
MTRKKVPKKAKRRLLIFGPLAVFVIIYCLFTFVTTSINLYNLRKEEKMLNKKLAGLKADADSLKNEINKLQDKEYIARYARENYLYTKNGEYVIKLDEDGNKIKEVKVNYNDEYVIYGCFVIITLIFIFVILKHFRKKKKKRKKKK